MHKTCLSTGSLTWGKIKVKIQWEWSHGAAVIWVQRYICTSEFIEKHQILQNLKKHIWIDFRGKLWKTLVNKNYANVFGVTSEPSCIGGATSESDAPNSAHRQSGSHQRGHHAVQSTAPPARAWCARYGWLQITLVWCSEHCTKWGLIICRSAESVQDIRADCGLWRTGLPPGAVSCSSRCW